jgi:hypothetical protein
MEVYKCGILVVVKLANIKGMITCCSIRFTEIRYEITYYEGLIQRTIWVHENEFEITEPEIQKIGFKK